MIRAIQHVVVTLLLTIVPTCGSLHAAPKENPMVEAIVIEGNKYVKTEAILKHLPYKVGEAFDPEKSDIAIKNLYNLGQFRQVTLEQDDSAHGTTLYVVVEEKKLLEKFTFTGNKSMKATLIKEKLSLDKVKTIDEETLGRIAHGIEKLYAEEGRHLAKVDFSLEVSKDKDHLTISIGKYPTREIVSKVKISTELLDYLQEKVREWAPKDTTGLSEFEVINKIVAP